jgi:hypothetical protein
MDALSRDQMDQMAEDISYVKKAIEKNISILRQIDFRSSLRLVSLISACAIFLFCGLFHMLVRHSGSFAAVPTPIKAIFFSTIALIAIVLGFIKNTGILKSARSLQPSISLFRLLREYYSTRILRQLFPLGLVFIFACAYAVATGNSRLIIPILSIGAGLIYCSLDTLLRIDEFLYSGYWFIITGCIVMVFNTVSPLLSLALTFGCGLLLLSAIWYLPQKKQTEG